jgi:hypothetical protein
MTINLLLLVVALVLFVVVAAGLVPAGWDPGRPVAAGLAFFAASHLPIR